jgi:hypothetical protein
LGLAVLPRVSPAYAALFFSLIVSHIFHLLSSTVISLTLRGRALLRRRFLLEPQVLR